METWFDDATSKMFDRYRDYVKHQYDLTNHRTTWFVAINSFLFATFAFTLQKKMEILSKAPDLKNIPIMHDADVLMTIIAFVGAYSALVAFILLESARRPIGQIAEKWDRFINVHDVQSEKVSEHLVNCDMLLLVGGVSRRAAFWGRFGTPLFTIVIAGAWLALTYFSSFTLSLVDGDKRWYAVILIIMAIPIATIVFNGLAYWFGIRIIPNPHYG